MSQPTRQLEERKTPPPGTEIEYLWFQRDGGCGVGAMCGRRESPMEVGTNGRRGGEGQDKEACLLLALLCDLRQALLRASVSVQIKQ